MRCNRIQQDQKGFELFSRYFIGAFDLSASWSQEGVKGCRRFLERVWKLQDSLSTFLIRFRAGNYALIVQEFMPETGIQKVKGGVLHSGYVPVPEESLPLELPDVESYMPTDNGESPLLP